MIVHHVMQSALACKSGVSSGTKAFQGQVWKRFKVQLATPDVPWWAHAPWAIPVAMFALPLPLPHPLPFLFYAYPILLTLILGVPEAVRARILLRTGPAQYAEIARMSGTAPAGETSR